MQKPPKIDSEAARLETLESFEIMDTLPEKDFDDITAIASEICGAPIALISLLDKDRQWFKSHHGLQEKETPRDISFCGHAIASGPDIFEISDTSADARFADNPLVTGGPKISFYAGAPLIAKNGDRIGTLCVIDQDRKSLTFGQKNALRALANQVMANLELRKLTKETLLLQARETELRQKSEMSERELSRVKRDLESAIAVAGVGFWNLDPATSKIVVDDRLLEHFGMTREKFDGTLDEAIARIHPADRDAVVQAIDQGVRGEIPYHIEYRILHPDSSVRWIEARGTSKKDEDGKSIFMGSTLDITHRKNIENKLENERAQLDQIFQASPAGMATWIGDDLVFERVNTEYEKIFPGRPLIGKPLLEALPEIRGQGFDDMLRSVLKTGEPVIGHEVVAMIQNDPSKPPEARYFNFSYLQLKDSEGNPYAVYDHSIDVTEAVNSRRELELARIAAEVANQTKSQFLANMSHEIRTPLGAIMGFASLLKDPSLGQSQHEGFVSVIERNSTQLLRLVDDILDLSKVEAGMLVVEHIDFSLPEMLTDFTSLMGFKAREKGISFSARAITKLPAIINSDPTRLRQILINVIGNAIKFTERGSVDMRCSFNGELLEFEVEDTGRGISPEQLKNLFQPFSQADASITRQYGGTGLGLVLSRNLAAALGGTFELTKTEFGKGSTFKVCIKPTVQKGTEFVSALGFESAPVKTVSALGELSEMKILLVEDSPDNQALISIFLSRAGAQTDIASDGAQGYEMALKNKYDVVLMDVQMPIMDGITAIRNLRARDYRGWVIALTAHAMKEERDRCIEAGFNDFLSKPVSRNELITALKKLRASV